MGHARALLGTPDRAFQEQLAKRIVADDLSVRAVEEAVREHQGAAKSGRATTAEPASAARRTSAPARAGRARGAARRPPRDAGEDLDGQRARQGRGRVLDPRGPRADLPADDRRRAARAGPADARSTCARKNLLRRGRSSVRLLRRRGGSLERSHRRRRRRRVVRASRIPATSPSTTGSQTTAAIRVSRSTRVGAAARGPGGAERLGAGPRPTAVATDEARLGAEAARREVAAPAGTAGVSSPARGRAEEEVGAVAVGGCGHRRTRRRRRRRGRCRRPPRASRARSPRRRGASNPGPAATNTRRALEAARVAAQRLALARRRHRAFGQRADAARGRRCVSRPQMPSVVRPALRWNSVSARRVSGAEDPVLLAGVEAQRVQAALELGDVVAPEHRPAAVEEAIAEARSRSRPAPPRSPGRRCRRRGCPRASWNARTAVSVASPNVPSLDRRDLVTRARPSRTWRSRTASPLLPGRSTAGSLKR